MRVSHSARGAQVEFDDPNLLADGGLAQVMGLAEKIDLSGLVDEHVRIKDAANSGGANAGAKVLTIIAGMICGADSFDDLGRLRHGAMGRVFTGGRAVSTCGTFLRSFTHGHVKQLHAVLKAVLVALVSGARDLLPDADVIAFVDVDSMHRQVYGYQKQGAVNGRLKGQKTLHPLLATISTPVSRPVLAAIRMRKGNAADVRGATSFVAEALGTARSVGCTGVLVLRGDAKFFTADICAAARRAKALVSLTTGSNPAVTSAITAYDAAGGTWTPIHYPDAFVDEDTGELISDAEVAQMPFTAFTGKRKALRAEGRLIVRRVRRLNPKSAETTAGQAEQTELFQLWRHHAVFVTGDFEMLQAEAHHRQHAIHEQVNAEAKAGALAHLPSGSFQANAAWATLWAIAHNLTRTTGVLAGGRHTRATTATIRNHLINIPTRIAYRARKLTFHMPVNWPWRHDIHDLRTAISRWQPRIT
jgi:hypothetical protein